MAAKWVDGKIVGSHERDVENYRLRKENKALKEELELAVGMYRAYKAMHAEVLAARQ